MFTISPSIYSADLLELGNVLKSLTGFEHLHLDIDDGNFVRGISFGIETVKGIAAHTDIPLDAHLEVLNPLDYVEPLAAAGVEMICAHVEALAFPSLFLSTVHQYHKKAGLALNIKTPVAFIEPYAEQLDQIIFVSCEADVDGLPFRPGVLKKVSEARRIFGPDMPIWVDGGINESNLASVVAAGADGVVLGRAIFGTENPSATYAKLLEQGRNYQKGE